MSGIDTDYGNCKNDLEPGMFTPGLDDNMPITIRDVHLMYSQATSLKRIADTFQRIVDEIEKESNNGK